jgi:hypothetical protein
LDFESDGELHSYEVTGAIYQGQKQWAKAAEAYREAIQRIELLRAETKEQSLETSLFEKMVLPYESLTKCRLRSANGQRHGRLWI